MRDIVVAIYYVAKLLIELIEQHKKNRPNRPKPRR